MASSDIITLYKMNIAGSKLDIIENYLWKIQLEGNSVFSYVPTARNLEIYLDTTCLLTTPLPVILKISWIIYFKYVEAVQILSVMHIFAGIFRVSHGPKWTEYRYLIVLLSEDWSQ